MKRKLLILSSLVSLAAGLPASAAANSGPKAAAASEPIRSTVVCHGAQNVPVTADAEQALPMQLVARLKCGAEVAVVSDSDGYTVQVRTNDGKDGYVARMYLADGSSPLAKEHHAVEAVVDNGIARWQSGAPGSEQFFSNGSLVESLTAGGVTVQVSLQDTGWKLRATVAIANESADQVHFNPAGFTLDELKPRLRSLNYQNPRELAKALTHQVYSTNASAVAPASAAYVNATFKSSVYVAATPNYLARDTQEVQSSILEAGVIEPKEKTSGVVWFERDKNPQQLNLRIFVGDQIFEFPLSFPQHN